MRTLYKIFKRYRLNQILGAGFIAAGLSLALTAWAQESAVENATQPPKPVVYQIPFKGEVESALYKFLSRGFDEARQNKATYIIVEMHTPGGRLDAALEIIDLFKNSKVPVALYVNTEAISAGALISLAADKVYMQHGGTIGAAEPVMGGGGDMGEGMKRKALSYVLAQVRALGEEMGHSQRKVDLAEAMVDSRKEIADPNNPEEYIIREGDLLSLTANEAEALDFINGVVKSRDEVLAQLGLEEATITVVDESFAEIMARFLSSMAVSSLLLTIGFLGIFVEIRTPGFGIPGLIGAIALALFFGGHTIAGLAGMEGAVLFLVGAVLLSLELFVIPGFGLPGIAGILCMLGAIVITLLDSPPGSPHFGETLVWEEIIAAVMLTLTTFTMAAIGAMAVPVLFPFMVQSRFGGWMQLKDRLEGEKGYMSYESHDEYVGKQGVTKSTLRPTGVAEIDGKRMEVVSAGGFIQPQTPVEVVKVEGRRVVVKPL